MRRDWPAEEAEGGEDVSRGIRPGLLGSDNGCGNGISDQESHGMGAANCGGKGVQNEEELELAVSGTGGTVAG